MRSERNEKSPLVARRRAPTRGFFPAPQRRGHWGEEKSGNALPAGVEGAIIISAGFKETGEKGRLTREVVRGLPMGCRFACCLVSCELDFNRAETGDPLRAGIFNVLNCGQNKGPAKTAGFSGLTRIR